MALGVVILGYLLGSIPFSYLVGRLAAGIDIGTVGSKNVGAHNVMLEVGRVPGILALLLDMGKGAAPVLLAELLNLSQGVALLAGVCAVLGHDFPLFLRFRGGRGLASSMGVALALMLREALIGALILLVVYLLLTRNVAFSAAVGLVSMIVLAWLFGRPLTLVLSPLALMFLLGLRQFPEAWAMWMGAEDKRDLILHKWIFDRDARI